MEVKNLQAFQLAEVLECLLLDYLFFFPEATILVEILLVYGHLDDLTLSLETTEHILVNDSAIIHIREELIHLFDFPLT